MAEKPIDLTKLKDEIHSRKNKKETIATNLGESNTATAVPKDSFLNELVVSLQTGQKSVATNVLKEVEHKAAIKAGEVRPDSGGGTVASELGKHAGASIPTAPVAGSNERDHLLFEELERKKKEMLSGGAANLSVTPQSPQAPQGGGVITEHKLYEAVDEVIKDKFAHIVEHAMKDSIVEIYAVTRMKEVMDENRQLIKEVVIETIRELQAESKKKKTQS